MIEVDNRLRMQYLALAGQAERMHEDLHGPGKIGDLMTEYFRKVSSYALRDDVSCEQAEAAYRPLDGIYNCYRRMDEAAQAVQFEAELTAVKITHLN